MWKIYISFSERRKSKKQNTVKMGNIFISFNKKRKIRETKYSKNMKYEHFIQLAKKENRNKIS